jgi:hypothetical protein
MESNFDTERTLLLKESNIFEPKSYLSGINSGSGKGVPEISIEGIMYAEELWELIPPWCGSATVATGPAQREQSRLKLFNLLKCSRCSRN